MSDERAVSEVVGFILVFALVLGTISFVYVGGFTQLEETRDHEQMSNAKRAFDVLANNFEDLGRGQAPSRATEIKLAGAGLQTTEPTVITVNSTGKNASEAQPRSIVYRPETSDSAVVYETGAVLREDGERAIMVREPDFVFGPNRTVLRVIETRGGLQSVGGDTTTLVRGERDFQEIRHQNEDPDTQINVTIRVDPATRNPDPWEEYLDESLTEAYDSPTHSCTTTNGEVICTDIMTHSVFFGATGVQIELV